MTDPARRAALEEERTFLLASLRDLDDERAAGDVDEHDYVALRDGYTKRAAVVLRQLDAVTTRTARPARQRWGRRLAVAAAVLLVGGLAGWWVARSSGQRLAGQELSGVDPRSDIAVALATARQLAPTEPLAALQQYDAVLAVDPNHPEALTYRGWVLYTTLANSGQDDIAAQATDDARTSLQAAVAADATYADPHCFLAVIARNADDDVATARTEAETCLALDPPADARALIESFLTTLTSSPEGSTLPEG